MKKNTCGYSYEWQPYKMDYDKFEYDIKLKDGRIIEGCYPNAGKFAPLDEETDYPENEIAEIRFTHNPKWGISKPPIENNMNTTEKTVYWVCKETVHMKGTKEMAFIEGKEYLQLGPIKNNVLILKDEQGFEHRISENMRDERFEEKK